MGVGEARGIVDGGEEGGGGDGADAGDRAQARHARILNGEVLDRRIGVRELLVEGAHDGEQRRDHRAQAARQGEALDPVDKMLRTPGGDAVAVAISQGMWAFTQFPHEKRKWQADLDGLSASAVEEIIRWASPVMHMRRTVTRDTTFAGVQMQRNQKIAMWYISANRDEKYFPDPYRFDIARTPNEHGAFGTGAPHFCLGSHLARREVTAMFVELFRRLPDIEATGEPEKLRSNFIRGIKRLPVAFKPA